MHSGHSMAATVVASTHEWPCTAAFAAHPCIPSLQQLTLFNFIQPQTNKQRCQCPFSTCMKNSSKFLNLPALQVCDATQGLQTDGLHIGSLEITRGLRSSKIRPVMTRLADRAD